MRGPGGGRRGPMLNASGLGASVRSCFVEGKWGERLYLDKNQRGEVLARWEKPSTLVNYRGQVAQ